MSNYQPLEDETGLPGRSALVHSIRATVRQNSGSYSSGPGVRNVRIYSEQCATTDSFGPGYHSPTIS